MNFKTTYILFGTLVVLLMVLLVSQKGYKETSTTGYVLPSLHEAKIQAKDIDAVELERKGQKPEKLLFVRGERGWRLAEPSVRANTLTVEELINQVIRAAKTEHGTADVTDNPEQFGLNDPSTVVTLKKGSEQQWKLFVGTESAGSQQNALLFVNSSDLPKSVMAVPRSQLDYLYKSVNDFRAHDLLAEGALNFPDVVSFVKLQAANGAPVILEKSDKNRWKFDKPPYGDADEGGEPTPGPGRDENRQTGMRGLLLDLQGLRADTDADFVADDVADMSKYGLEANKPAWLRIEIKRRVSNIVPEGEKPKIVDDVLLVGNKADDKGDKRYARLESERSVVTVPSRKLDPVYAIAENPSSLRNRDLVEIDSWKTDAIDLQGPEGKLELRRTGTPETWKLYQAGKKLADADFGAVQDLLKTLNTKKQVKEFIDNDKAAGLGFDKPAAVVSLWVDGIKKEERKQDEKKDEKKPAEELPQLKTEKPTVRLTFGKKEKDLVYVQRESGDDKSVVAVADALLTKVSQGALAYRERVLPSFSENADVLKLALRRDKETFVLEKSKKDDKVEWSFQAPKELVGRKAEAKSVDRILGELRRMRTDRLVADKPADLDQYGLKQPLVQATVTVKKGEKETEDWVYELGKETPDGRFAKQGQRDLVFIAQPRDLDAVLHAELQDPTVFKFDANKVTGLKLTGWESLGIGTQTLEMTREPGKGWTAKLPPNFNLDPAQADAFVTGLGNLAADRFVSRGAGAQAAHRLKPTERLFTVEITVEGEKQPLTLTFGAVDPEAKAYFAAASSLPNDVFLLPQSRFEKLATTGIKYFSKAK